MVWISLVSECPVCIRECYLNIKVRVIPVQLKAVVCVTHLKTSCRWVDIGKPGSLASKTRVISEWSAVPGGWAGLSQELGLAPVTRDQWAPDWVGDTVTLWEWVRMMKWVSSPNLHVPAVPGVLGGRPAHCPCVLCQFSQPHTASAAQANRDWYRT